METSVNLHFFFVGIFCDVIMAALSQLYLYSCSHAWLFSDSWQVEELLKNFENVCTLRVRMPISSDLSNPRNFITKITRYEKVVNIPNSMTILDELLPISIEMAKRNLTGIWNFTNPGVVSHNEILEMYRQYIDPNFTWKNFTLEEQAKVIVAPRSNNELDASKLKTEFPELLSIEESLIKYVFEPNKKTTGVWNSLGLRFFSFPIYWILFTQVDVIPNSQCYFPRPNTTCMITPLCISMLYSQLNLEQISQKQFVK